MLNKLYEMKAKAEHDLLYAQAKIEIVSELIAEVSESEPEVETVVEDFETEVEEANL